jgi:N-acetyl-alpha-D-muramate 1-phosphate uridylyltransferase
MPTSLPPVCILAGGLGTRLGSRVRDTPKPLLEVAGEPFLNHQLRLLKSWGAREIVLCVGYLGQRIEDAIGHDRFGLRISYSYDGPTPIGTLGAVRKAAPRLGPNFLILYGDTYLRLDYANAADTWLGGGRLGLMTVLRNRGQWDRSNVVFDGSLVTLYDKRSPTEEMEWIDYGLGGLLAEALEVVGEDVDDLSDLYHALSRAGELSGYAATERFYEIGTPEALSETEAFLAGLPDDS